MHIKVIHTKLDVTYKLYNDNRKEKKQRSVFGMYSLPRLTLPNEFLNVDGSKARHNHAAKVQQYWDIERRHPKLTNPEVGSVNFRVDLAALLRMRTSAYTVKPSLSPLTAFFGVWLNPPFSVRADVLMDDPYQRYYFFFQNIKTIMTTNTSVRLINRFAPYVAAI